MDSAFSFFSLAFLHVLEMGGETTLPLGNEYRSKLLIEFWMREGERKDWLITERRKRGPYLHNAVHIGKWAAKKYVRSSIHSVQLRRSHSKASAFSLRNDAWPQTPTRHFIQMGKPSAASTSRRSRFVTQHFRVWKQFNRFLNSNKSKAGDRAVSIPIPKELQFWFLDCFWPFFWNRWPKYL